VAGHRPAEQILRKREDARQASFLELFFDLAFIVALTLLSKQLLLDLEWTEVAQTLVLLAAAWWIWIATAWATDWYNPSEPFIQRLVLGIMFGGLLMAAAIPEAFGAHGIVFAGAYVAIHIGRGLALIWALRGHPIQRRSIVVTTWFGISAIPWLAGAFLPAPHRLVLWLAAVAIDYGIAWFGWPTLGVRRVKEERLRTAGEHLSERYRQVFIIALSETVLLSGMAYSGRGFDPVRTLAYAISFGNAVLLWRIYFVPAGSRLGIAIDENRPRTAISAAYCHAVMVAGTVFTAIGDEVLITQPLGETRAAWAALIVGGSALFLAGRTLIDLIVYRHLSWQPLIGLFVTVAMMPGMLLLPPLGVATATNLVLIVVALSQMLQQSRASG
jgi:low temperature requirement protein LtrA